MALKTKRHSGPFSLFLKPCHLSLWGSPLISWHFSIKEHKLISSPCSTGFLLWDINRGSTLNANGVEAEASAVTKSLSSILTEKQGPVSLPNDPEWVIILAAGIMFQWQWQSRWWKGIKQVGLRGFEARISFWEFIWQDPVVMKDEKHLLKLLEHSVAPAAAAHWLCQALIIGVLK